MLGFVLSGCDPPSWYGASTAGGGKPKPAKLNVSVQFAGSETLVPGTTTPGPSPGQFTVQNQIARGTFSATLPKAVNVTPPKAKKRAAAAGGGAVKSVSGTFVARLSGTFTPATGTGSFTGVQVLRFSPAKVGDACLTFTSSVTNSGRNETGSFTLAGGTKAAARARFSGSYTLALNFTTPTTATVTGSIIGSGKVGKPARAPTPDCQALTPQL